jgi:uncharacterized alkaline shock family protein YloU
MIHVKDSELGAIYISKDILATYIGLSATGCFGVVGMSSKTLKDGFATLLGKDSISRGVEIVDKDDTLQVNVYIIVGYGTKISEIANSVIQRIEYNVREELGIRLDKINLVVQGVRILD